MRDLDTGKNWPRSPFWAAARASSFSPDGQHLLMGGPTGKVKVWDFGRNAFLDEFDTGQVEETHPLLCVPGADRVLMHHLAGMIPTKPASGPLVVGGSRRYYTLWHCDQRRLVAEFRTKGRVAELQPVVPWRLRGVRGDGSFSVRGMTPLLAPITFCPTAGGTDVAFTPDGSIRHGRE
jgi:WD40 repeat protein